MTELSRRSFIKLAAVGLAAQPALAQWQVRKETWKLGETGGKNLEEVSVVSTICPYCGVSCSIDLYTDGSRVVWSRGSPDSPINNGTLCSKGKAAYQLLDNHMRVVYPMIRTGPKPPPEEILNAKTWEELEAVLKKYPPQWRRVSWDEAFRHVAERLGKILEEWRAKTGAPKRGDGFYYLGRETPVQIIGSSVMNIEESYLTRKLAAFVGSSNIDSQYRKCHSSTVAGLAVTYGWGIESGTFEDLYHSDVVLFFSSPAEAHPVSMAHFYKAKKERNTIFVVFDPRYSRTAAVGDLWVPFRSGTETAIFLYVLHHAFFERNPPIDQLDEFKRLAKRWNISQEDLEDLKELLKEYTLNNVAEITGTPPELLKAAATIFVENSGVATGHKKHGTVQWAMGITQHTNATINIIRAIAVMQLLLGNTGYPGGGVHPFRGWTNVQGTTDVQGGGLGNLPGYASPPSSPFDVRLYQDWKLQGMPDAWSWEVPTWARDRFRTTAPERGKADLPKVLQVYNFYSWRRAELTWGMFCGTVPEDDPQKGVVVCDIPLGAGSSEVTVMRRALAGEVKAMFIFGENVAVTNPNSRLVFAALSSLDLLVVSDLFENETAYFADVLLPAAAFAEKEGTKVNTGTVMQWSWRAAPPKGLSRPDYWIIVNLYHYLRRYGAVKLPSEVFGKRSEEVKIKRGATTYTTYVRALSPDYSWDYRGGAGAAHPVSEIESEVNPRLIYKELNFNMLIYHGMYDPIRDEFKAMRRIGTLRKPGQIDGLFSQAFEVYKDWGWAWPMNVRIKYTYDALPVMLGKSDVVSAAGRQWVVTGETGEWIDEFTGEYKPAFIPGHNYWAPRSFKRRLSGVADLFGGLDILKTIRTGEVAIQGKFVTEEGLVDYEKFVERTGMKYLWANDTLYWDEDTTSLKAALKRPYFAGGDWRSYKPKYEEFRQKLDKFYRETGSLRDAVKKVIEDMKGWYSGYNFQWPIHTEPVETPSVETAVKYPTLAWIHPYNLDVLNERPDVTRGKPVGVALEPKEVPGDGEVVVITSNRLTEHMHSGAMTRNSPSLAQLVPEPFAILPKSLASRLGVSTGDQVEISTARGSVRLKAVVSSAQMAAKVGRDEYPVVNVVWAWGFKGLVTGPHSNLLVPDVVDVVTTIQESKAWMARVRKARL